MPDAAAENPIRPAATILVVRPGAAGEEVFMLKRHARSVFMPSAHVFPGGRVEAEDRALAERLPPAAQAHALAQLDGLDDPVTAAAFAVAAIRETAEECGLVLARDGAGRVLDAEAARQVFEDLHEGVPFARALAAREALPDLVALQAFGWWITPPFEPRRYDTRFFLAAAPPAQHATCDNRETTEGLWIRPEEALRLFHAGRLLLAPPTLASLELLARAGSAVAALDALPRPLRPIRPRMVTDAGGERVLVLPGDPLYPGDEAPALPHRTRFRVLGKGRFA